MKLLFIDETQDNNNKEYLGICCSLTDLTFYGKLKTEFNDILEKFNWDKGNELKGNAIFSIKNGDKNVNIGDRINLVKDLLEENISKKNSRIKFAFVKCKTTKFKVEYLNVLPKLLDKFLVKAPKNGAGKNIISIHCDHHSAIKPLEIENSIKSVLNKKNYILLEGVHCVQSNNESIGVIYTDIVGYLIGRIDNIKNDIDLFNNLDDSKKKTSFRKLETSTELIKVIKHIEFFKYGK